jgi:hypothetical protein
MVITQSLAKGALREVIRKQREMRQELISRIDKVGLEPPSTKRRYAEWFRQRKAIHEKEALLIAHGMVGRRTGAFAAYSLGFVERDKDWGALISVIYIEFCSQSIVRCENDTLPVTISGHALERIFQRTDSINWSVVRDYLAGAVLFANATASAWLKSGCERCAVLAEKGMFVGQVADALYLRTFLPETQLAARWEALYRDLKTFSKENEQAIKTAALGSGDEASIAFEQFLKSGSHRWLFQPYIPGKDLEEDAWRAPDVGIEAVITKAPPEKKA